MHTGFSRSSRKYNFLPVRMSDNCKGSDQILQLSANCRVLFFIVEKSVVMVYNKLFNFAGVMGDFIKSGLE